MKDSFLGHTFTLKETAIIFIITFGILQMTAFLMNLSLTKQVANAFLDIILFTSLYYYKRNQSRKIRYE